MLRHLITAVGLAASMVSTIVASDQLPRGDAAPIASAAAGDPYQVTTFCPSYPVNGGRRVMAANGAELQQALDDARSGDTIVLAVGATFHPITPDGSFILRNRPISAGQWVTIRSASAEFDPSGSVPPDTRVEPSKAALMPRIRAIANNAAAIRTEPRAHGYRLVGLDIGGEPTISQMSNLVELGSAVEASVSNQPSDIIVDRSYLHGSDSGNFRRGIAMNGARLSVIESYLENFHDANTDSQAVGGWNGSGPIRIVNNFLEAAGENIMFGGGDPLVPGLIPSDIEVRRNFVTKRLSWQTAGVVVKNAFELKNARRVLVEGNTFEHVWVSGQDGTAILLKSVNQDGGCPWCVTEYVTFRNNIVRDAANGVVINAAETGRKGLPLPVRVNHVRFENVLFERIGGAGQGGGGYLLRVFGGVSDASFTHITSRGNPNSILFAGGDDDVNPRLIFRYNIVERMWYGIGTGSNEGKRTLERNFPGYTYSDNVLVNTSGPTDQAVADATLAARYPPRTWVVSDWNGVGFQPGSSRLASTSRYFRAGEDHKDIGADLDAIQAAQAGPPGSTGCGTTGAPAQLPGGNVPGAQR